MQLKHACKPHEATGSNPPFLPSPPFPAVQVSGAADAVKAAKAEALRFEGRGLLAALEAVQRELA